MYPNSHPTRHPSETLNSHYISSTLGEFIGYQNGPGIGEQLHTASAGVWNHVYAAPRDEWCTYGHSFAGSSPNVGQVIYSSPELTESCMPTAGGGGPLASYNLPAGDHSPNHQKNSSYGWIRHSGHPSGSEGKTRTKDKYRVVYTDHQRLELEKEFQYSRYITIRRKTELSLQLSLSERQVKIWFQNRRAKERKLNRRKLQLSQEATLTRSAPPGPDPTSHPAPTSPTSTVVSDTMSAHVKEEY